MHFACISLPVLAACITGIFDGGIRIESLNVAFSLGMFASVVVVLISAFRGAYLFAREKEKKTYDDIIATALPPEEIVLGKFWFTFYPAATELIVFFPFYLTMGALLNMSVPFLLFIYTFSLTAIALFP